MSSNAYEDKIPKIPENATKTLINFIQIFLLVNQTQLFPSTSKMDKKNKLEIFRIT
ncbi:hypothetical protein NWE61_04000 [Mycoplasmopsis felis]|uniref:hypothetical protein n=1 Tax=Mycoplasmopsis felis TaxID=33923 RepID=UPI0021DFAB45|nr:hypothetical protein [Mycoplasmopsis felis]MCU9934291.1 hypothetical protein [Mycoplasmopsis felis]